MFNPDFYPTPSETIIDMLQNVEIPGRVFLEPSAGKGNIVKAIQRRGGEVIACENDPDLAMLTAMQCQLIANDFFTVTSEMISHISGIIMNPPFSQGAAHINHAFAIAPEGCQIVALCNTATIENAYTKGRQQLAKTIEMYGEVTDLGDCFDEAERKTGVNVSMIVLTKPAKEGANEFEGFFMDEDPEEVQVNGIMEYNVIRELVNRYVAAVKLYDEQLTTGAKMNALLSSFYGEKLAFTCTEKGMPKLRSEFKKDMQKEGWKYIFQKMRMDKYVTKGVRDDINKFVEQQTALPFTMKNIYRMLEIVVGTWEQNIDRAILEAFDNITKHTSENQFAVEGWKTNSHFLLTQTFIMPNVCEHDNRWPTDYVKIGYGWGAGQVDDIVKALCFITGIKFDECTPLNHFFDSHTRRSWGTWYSWGFFEVKGHKKGSMHFRFNSPELWATFNQRIAKIKGYPLFEGKEQTAYQKRQTGRSQAKAF